MELLKNLLLVILTAFLNVGKAAYDWAFRTRARGLKTTIVALIVLCFLSKTFSEMTFSIIQKFVPIVIVCILLWVLYRLGRKTIKL